MKPKPFTHRGTIHVGYGVGKINRIDLRETTLYWVTKRGAKYRKRDGWPTGVDWTQERLDLKSIKNVTNIDDTVDECLDRR